MEIIWVYNTSAGIDIDIEYSMSWQWYEELDLEDFPRLDFYNSLQKIEQN